MSEGIAFEFKQEQVTEWANQIDRAQKVLGKSLLSSTQWAARLFLSSVAASTNVSKKMRPVVKNPDKRYLTDRRVAPYGVFVYKRGVKTFKPIYRTGEYGKLRFYDSKSVSWFKRDAANPKGKWEKIASGADPANPEIIAPGIKTDKRRIIGRRGFAKKTWQWAKGRVGSGGTLTLMRVPGIAEIAIDKDPLDPSITITNRVNYMGEALKGGVMAIDTAMDRAMRGMATRINQEAAKKLGLK